MFFELFASVADFMILAVIFAIFYKLHQSRSVVTTLALVTPAIYVGLMTIGAVLTPVEVAPEVLAEGGPFSNVDPWTSVGGFGIGNVWITWAQSYVLGTIGLGYELYRRGFKLRRLSRSSATS